MFGSNFWLLTAVILAAAGLYLMLPPRGPIARGIGTVLSAAAFGLFASLALSNQPWSITDPANLFWVMGLITVASATMTVTSRNPVYCALWFGMTLLGTAGMFLVIGAQFLAVATIVVYAGAILVTFLFVLMLATPQGNAPYDRLTWEPLLSATAGAVLVGVLTTTIVQVRTGLEATAGEQVAHAAARKQAIEHPEHMARLGRELFSTHLVSVEAAGALLFVGLVGAAAIIAHGRARDKVAGGQLPTSDLPPPHPPIPT